MVTRRQNSRRITICQIWIKSAKQLNGNYQTKQSQNYHLAVSVADLRGDTRDARLPWGGPNSFNFMQFLGKFGKIVCWWPPLWGSWGPLLGEILDPPLCLTDFSKSDEWQFGDCFVSSVQTQTHTQTEPEACTMHILNY